MDFWSSVQSDGVLAPGGGVCGFTGIKSSSSLTFSAPSWKDANLAELLKFCASIRTLKMSVENKSDKNCESSTVHYSADMRYTRTIFGLLEIPCHDHTLPYSVTGG